MDPETRTALEGITQRLARLEGNIVPLQPPVEPGPGITPGPAPNWWRPTSENQSVFASLYGLNPEDLEPWTFDPHGNVVKPSQNSFPILPALDPDDPADVVTAVRYAAFGYSPEGLQRLSTDVGFKQSRDKADEVFGSNSPEEANAFLRGAGDPGVEMEAALYGCMTGLAQFSGFQTPTFGGGKTVRECMVTHYKKSTRKPGDPGAGIAGA